MLHILVHPMKFLPYTLLTMSLLFSLQIWASEVDKAIELFEKGKVDEAESIFKQTKDHPIALSYLARIYLAKDLDEAEEYIELATELDSDNPEISYYRGIVMSEQASNSIFSALSYAEKSLGSFQRAVELAPDELKYRHGLMMFYLMAPGIAGGDQQLAQAQLVEIQQLSEYQGMHAELDFLWQLEDQRKFTDAANKAIKRYPELPDFYQRHGMLLQHEEQYDQAIALFSIAQKKTTMMKKSLESKYSAIYQIGKTAVLSEAWLEEGISALEIYLTEAPKSKELPSKDWATYRLAQLFSLQKKDKEARQLLTMLNNSDDEAVRKAAKKLIRKI